MPREVMNCPSAADALLMTMTNREKVIKGLECHLKELSVGKTCFECPYCGDNPCEIQLIANTIALLKERGWNVLTEDADGVIHGLPGDDGQYIMTDGKDIWIDDYVDGVADGIILDSGRDIRELTAWMYMPELPKKVRR